MSPDDAAIAFQKGSFVVAKSATIPMHTMAKAKRWYFVADSGCYIRIKSFGLPPTLRLHDYRDLLTGFGDGVSRFLLLTKSGLDENVIGFLRVHSSCICSLNQTANP